VPVKLPVARLMAFLSVAPWWVQRVNQVAGMERAQIAERPGHGVPDDAADVGGNGCWRL
jgi:hypothetical protein